MILSKIKPLAAILFVSSNVWAAHLNEQVPLETKAPAFVEPWQRYSGWAQDDWEEFATLAAPLLQAISPAQKVGEIHGDPQKGKKLIEDRSRGGGCYACHIMPNANLPGNVGPDLSTIGNWDRTDEYLYNRIYDPRIVNPTTVMPPWGAHKIFNEQEIYDMVAYLKTLKESVPFKNVTDDPEKRPVPVEERPNLDPLENPAMFATEEGERLYAQMCSNCHQSPQLFQSWAVTMPKYSTAMNKMIGVEEFVTRHARATRQINLPMQSNQNLALSTFLRFISNGKPLQVDISDPETQSALVRGEKLAQTKIGQLNFACTDCHQIASNRWIRGQYLADMKSMIDHFPLYRTSRGELWDIRKRFQWCNVAIRANELPPDAKEYGDLELYLTQYNRGAPMNVPGIRH
ncbi:MAG: sulfur oxidation c-type cytochrome SoxA [Pseudomonadota bacterium]|jgi:sulfur-oxidizing protein SoxA